MTIPLPLYPVRHHEPCCRPARLPNLHQADDPGACPPESGGTSGDSDLQVRSLRRSLLKNQRRQVNLRHSPPSSPGRGTNDLRSAFRRNRIRAIAWLCLFIFSGISGLANAKARVGTCVAGSDCSATATHTSKQSRGRSSRSKKPVEHRPYQQPTYPSGSAWPSGSTWPSYFFDD